MATLFYNENILPNNLLGGGKTTTDIEYITRGIENPSRVSRTISDSEYDNLVNGTNSLVYENNTIVMRDEVSGDEGAVMTLAAKFQSIPQECHTDDFEYYKKSLEKIKNEKPNHSQISKINDALDHMSSMDSSNLTESIFKTLLDNNKFVALHVI